MKRRAKKTLPVYKMSGSGNDFILIDNRRKIVSGLDPGRLAASLCRHRLSVGGDGLILLEAPRLRKTHFRWRLFNADGSEAEMSGNGGRCAARLAYLLGIAPKKMVFETLAGPVRAEVFESGRTKEAMVKIEMPAPKDLRLEVKIPVEGRTYVGHFLNTGVPHTVLFVEDLDSSDVVRLGRAIRYHAFFQPAGTNVNFVSLQKPGSIRMRTYERGVEDETLACGTGAVATALVAGALGRGSSPTSLIQKSGVSLRVYYRWDGAGFSEVFLEGDARMVYAGTVWDEAWK
jgi:diaminopimelate epimerase